jgi:homoserine dehydrogenase
VFQRPAEHLEALAAADRAGQASRVYLRLIVRDRPGVLAHVTEALARASVSIDSFLQHPVGPTGMVPIVLTTQPASEAAIRDAVQHISEIDAVVEAPRTIRIARG